VIEGNYIPPLPGLLIEKWKCKEMLCVTARRELNTIKLSLLLTYNAYRNAGKKRNKTTIKTKLIFVNYTVTPPLGRSYFTHQMGGESEKLNYKYLLAHRNTI